MTKILRFIYWVVLTLLIFVGVITVLSVLGWPKDYRIFVVQSGSMEPLVKTHSLVVSHPIDDYKKGDIITFKTSSESSIKDPKSTITHRIFEVKNSKNSIVYITKGDANKFPDSMPVYPNMILGKVIASIPYLGYPIGFAKTTIGFVLLVVIPATIIVYSEVLNIKKEISKMLAGRKAKEEVKSEGVST